jgi:hypothetical protein
MVSGQTNEVNMPGVYRDRPSGEYIYYTYNQYEDRWRRQADDRAAGRNPFPFRPAWHPSPPPTPLTPVVQGPAAPTWDFEEFRARINAAHQTTNPQDVLAILTQETEPFLIDQPPDYRMLDQLIDSLPPSIGVKTGFDALFDFDDVSVLSMRQALEVLLPAEQHWWK